VQRGPTFDWILFGTALLLSISGLVYIYSATYDPGLSSWAQYPAIQRMFAAIYEAQGWAFSKQFIYQCFFLIGALGVFFIIRRWNWGLKPDNWLWFYVPVMIILVLVQLIGHASGSGSTRWINLGPINIQPSEFAKLGLTLILAWMYSGEPYEVRRRYGQALLVTASMLALVVIQPDLGTSLVFVMIFFVMSLFAAVPRRYIITTALVMVLMVLAVWFFRIPVSRDPDTGRMHGYQFPKLSAAAEKQDETRYIELLKRYQRARITAFLNPESDPQGSGYHILQSEIAVGNGGWTGQGFLRGNQIQEDFIPVVYSDFIFAVAAEEFGFFGAVWLLALYFILLFRILWLSRNVQTLYERYICYGTSAVIFFHVYVAIGMTVRLAPITGLPLPFVSYGGSALMTMWVYLAIMMSIFANTQRDFRRAKPLMQG
jgi:rod shape determining protein RodA